MPLTWSNTAQLVLTRSISINIRHSRNKLLMFATSSSDRTSERERMPHTLPHLWSNYNDLTPAHIWFKAPRWAVTQTSPFLPCLDLIMTRPLCCRAKLARPLTGSCTWPNTGALWGLRAGHWNESGQWPPLSPPAGTLAQFLPWRWAEAGERSVPPVTLSWDWRKGKWKKRRGRVPWFWEVKEAKGQGSLVLKLF